MAKKLNKTNRIGGVNAKIDANSPFDYVEAYKSLRTNIMFGMASSNKSHCFVVTSAVPAEGKSTVSANIAIALSQLGVKVLLVDADLRSPTQHHIFKIGNIKGLSQLIVGLEKYEDVINHDIEPNLDVITAGRAVPNPSELLGSANMAEMFSLFERDYEYVVIDTPPVNVVTDALMFADMTAGVLLAIRASVTTYGEMSKAISNIEMTKSPILGVVIVDGKDSVVSSRSYRRYSRYSRYGRYGYGYGNYGGDKDK